MANPSLVNDCFNPETWDFACGKEFTDETIDRVLELCSKDYIVGLSMLGGEPMHETNLPGSTKLAKAFKEKFPEKSLWSWTGFTYEGIKDNEIFNYLDVLVDGQYVDALHNPRLDWRGSENQRVIDVQKSLKNGEVTAWKSAS